MKTFWTESMPRLAFGNAQMLKFKIVSNGPDKTLGNMNPKRVQKVIADFQATFGKRPDRRSECHAGVDHDEQVHRHEHPPR